MKKQLNAALPYLLFTGLGAFSYFLLINSATMPEGVSKEFYSVGALLFFMLSFNIVGYSTIRLSAWMNNQYTLNIRRRWRISLIYGLVMLIFLLLNYGLLVTAKLLMGASSPFLFPNGGVRILLTVWLVELVILGLLIANTSIHRALELQKQAARLQQENSKARYVALQNQLNPHFLFNSLNTLIAEIEFNPNGAVRFTRNLSDVYRYVLQCQDRPLVTLAEEMEFAKSYLMLHLVRLGECITWQIEIQSDAMESMLPPLTLQLLVENVIKHNSITAARPMQISIRTQDGYLEVVNSISAKKGVPVSGVGLQNLSNRCRMIIGRDIKIENNGNRFVVKVPLCYE